MGDRAMYDYAGLAPNNASALREAFASLRTLGDVLDWARQPSPPWSVVEIVTQDEYTHDVVLGRTGHPYLAFDTT